MKKCNYQAPEVEFVEATDCDVLTTSNLERWDNDGKDPFVI